MVMGQQYKTHIPAIGTSRLAATTIEHMSLTILTEIGTGLSGLKTATELLRALRDGIKAGHLKADELSSRIGEIYDNIIDSKSALTDAKEEISRLQNELTKLTNIRDDFELRDNVFWRKGTRDAYCPLCLGADQKAVPLYHNGIAWHCGIHDKYFNPRSPH